MRLECVVLAAGKGMRMRSDTPKVLQPLGGRPLLGHVLDAARSLDPDRVHVVYGHGGDRVRAAFADAEIGWVHQVEQRGTGHAVATALPRVAAGAVVLVLNGDVPMVGVESLRRLAERGAGGLALLTARPGDPAGLGRIIRDDRGLVAAIVEERDANSEERAIAEIYTGFLAAPADRLRGWLDRVGADNDQGEQYLTDVVALAVADGVGVADVAAPDADEVLGANSKQELARLERLLQRREAARLLAGGVTLRDPGRVDVRGRVTTGRDCELDIDVILEGDVELGDRVRIGAYCLVRDSSLADDVVVEPHSVIDGARVGAGARLGPFARVRPGTSLGDGSRIGNFVETKNSEIGAGTKVNHLSYIGDSTLGRDVNIGAGTITCNYDGARKHRTVIGDGAFVGSNTELIAPVTVGPGAAVGAGSTISRDVPADALGLTRPEQRTVAGWARRKRRG